MLQVELRQITVNYKFNGLQMFSLRFIKLVFYEQNTKSKHIKYNSVRKETTQR